VGSRRDRLTAETAAIRSVLANGNISRLLLAWLASNAANYSFLVVTLVVAYDAGGPIAAGLLGVARYLPPTLVAPLAGLPAARWPGHRVLLAVIVARVVLVAATLLVLLTGAPIWLVFVLVGAEASFTGLTRPLHMSLLPWLARTPGELVASNIASSAAEALGTLIGPAVAGILLATSNAVGATAAVGVMIAIAAVAIVTVTVPSMKSRRTARSMQGATAGVRAFRHNPIVRLVTVDFGLQSGVRGMLAVLLVVAAIERLGMGEPGVGTLNAAIGVGGVAGAVVALSLTRRSSFAPVFSLSLAMWGLPIAVVGIVTDPLVAFAMLAIVGMSNAILDVAGFTLLQRGTPNDERVGVMGLIDSVGAGCAAMGGILASLLVSGLGIQGALLVAGAILPLAAVVTLPLLRSAESRLGSREAEAEVLRADPLLSLLSLSIVEELAGVMRPVAFDDGEALIREGERGSEYLIVTDGEVEVSRGGRPLRRLGPGHGVGEISLLRNVPRTATVTAVGQVATYALDRDAFLSALTGHSPARVAADAIIDDHLARTPDASASAG
jgi:MFS family permease